MTTQKLRITLDITVDPEAWELVYGHSPVDDNGRDLADYVLHSVMGSAATEAGCITRVDLR